MTAGPARRIVTLLPRNKPTPMAPPMAIMVSCLWPKRRRRPSTSAGDFSPSSPATTFESGWSVITADAGRVKNHQIDILLEHFHNFFDVVQGVVHMERNPQAVVTVRRDDVAFGELLHQQ